MGSESPPPSRPVIAGNVGLNCHLSEIISKIVEPITLTSEGFDIESTQNMLHIISKFNKELNNNEVEVVNKNMTSGKSHNRSDKAERGFFL